MTKSKVNQKQYKAFLIAAVKYLRFRPRSSFEVKRRLLRFAAAQNYSPDLIPQVIQRLEKEHFINDALLASNVAKFLLSKNKGPYFIKQKLSRFGFDVTLINQILAQQTQEDYISSIKNLINKKRLHLKGSSLQRKAKLIRFLSQRGFDFSSINQAIDEQPL
jgi:SOS response regulatory protein OraA/RecX